MHGFQLSLILTERPKAFVFMQENNNKPWWEPAVEIFSQVSGWIAGPIIVALIGGKALDAHFGTKPWIFLGLTGVAFFISIFGIIKVVSKYMKKITQEEDNKKN